MLGNIGAIYGWVFGGQQSAAGELIDDATALSIMDVYSCIRLISQTIGSLPLKLYETTTKGRMEAMDNYLYALLAVQPNPEMGSVVFWETVTGCLALTGNSYIYIQRVAGQVVALWPLNPRKTRPIRVPDGTPTGKIIYESREGFVNGQVRNYDSDDVLHFKLFSMDGMVGLSPIDLAREGLGIARAAEKMAGRVFANNAQPGGIMMSKAGLDKKDLLNASESWRGAHSGANAFKTAFLNGTEWEYIPLELNLEQMEFLKTRAYQRSEIAAMWGVPPHMIGDTTRQSNTNSEQESLTLVQFTLRPYLTKIENEIQCKLLPSMGRKANKYFVQFDVRELLRGDFKTTMDGLTLARQGGWMNADEIRAELGMNPIEDGTGKIYLTPVNYRNSADLLLEPEPKDEELLNPPASPEDTTPPLLTDGSEDDTNKPDNKGNVPTDNERSVVRYNPAIITLFEDCIGRLLARDRGTFRPLMLSLGLLCGTLLAFPWPTPTPN